VNAADIRPVTLSGQTQSTFDLLLIFVGANVVATTFQVGASLAPSFSLPATLALVAVGSVAGAALVAALAPLGPRLRVPSIIASRPALGFGGAGLVAVLLYVSNFAWIALNNVIAASACARVGAAWFGAAAGSQTAWAIALGLLATVVVWLGPRAVADLAVPYIMKFTSRPALVESACCSVPSPSFCTWAAFSGPVRVPPERSPIPNSLARERRVGLANATSKSLRRPKSKGRPVRKLRPVTALP